MSKLQIRINPGSKPDHDAFWVSGHDKVLPNGKKINVNGYWRYPPRKKQDEQRQRLPSADG